MRRFSVGWDITFFTLIFNHNCYYKNALPLQIDFCLFSKLHKHAYASLKVFFKVMNRTLRKHARRSDTEKQIVQLKEVTFAQTFYIDLLYRLRTSFLVRWKILAIFFTVPKIRCVGCGLFYGISVIKKKVKWKIIYFVGNI